MFRIALGLWGGYEIDKTSENAKSFSELLLSNEEKENQIAKENQITKENQEAQTNQSPTADLGNASQGDNNQGMGEQGMTPGDGSMAGSAVERI